MPQFISAPGQPPLISTTSSATVLVSSIILASKEHSCRANHHLALPTTFYITTITHPTLSRMHAFFTELLKNGMSCHHLVMTNSWTNIYKSIYIIGCISAHCCLSNNNHNHQCPCRLRMGAEKKGSGGSLIEFLCTRITNF